MQLGTVVFKMKAIGKGAQLLKTRPVPHFIDNCHGIFQKHVDLLRFA